MVQFGYFKDFGNGRNTWVTRAARLFWDAIKRKSIVIVVDVCLLSAIARFRE